MKKSLLRANIVIVAMLAIVTGLAFSNVRAVHTSADSRVYYAGNTEQNNVCFMINVYGGEEYIPDILDILDAYQVKTTFFVGGCWTVDHLALVREIYARGHELGNHGFYHKQQDSLSIDDNLQEIKMCHEVVRKNLNIQMTLFAPPSGAYNKHTVDAAESLGYSTIMWTHDTIDWRDQDAELIFKRATRSLSGGDLVLMHPTQKTVQALTKILSHTINSGFNPTTVSKTIA